MSRRVAADKRPRKQNLQTWQPEVPRGKADNQRRSGEWPRVARGQECLHRSLPPCVPKPERTIETGKAFIKTVQNVFFDSYYPKLQAEFSENSGSSNDASSRIATSESLELGDSLLSFSRVVGRNTSVSKESKTSDKSSSRSRLTLDSKTYTLFSCVSDVDTAIGKTDDGNGDGCRVEVDDRQQQQREQEGAEESPPLSDWFAQLCTRIETLEDLLQQTLVNSFQQKESKDSEVQKTERTKILVPKSTMLITDGPSNACVIPVRDEEDKRNDNEDTDNEVQNIKERVRALELKLQQTRMSDFLNSGKPSADFCDSTTPKSSVVLWEMGGGEECTCQKWRYESGSEMECMARRQHRRRRIYTSSTSESPLPGAKGEGKTEEEETDSKTKNKVKKKFIAKCRRIREICNSVASSSRQSSRTFKACKACNEVSYQQAIVTKEFLETIHRPPPFALSTPVNPDQQNNATLLYVKCQQETLAPLRRQRKRTLKKRRDLCRKTGLMNFGLNKVDKSQQWEEIPLRTERSDCGFAGGKEWEKEQRMQSRELEEIWTRGAAFEWSRHPKSAEVHPPIFEHQFRKNATCDCCSKKRKTRKKSSHSRSPMDILNNGGQIKIPVLFKEVCKPEEPLQKMSNISIRFVMVEEDTKHPLRKLMKKLSQKNSSRKEKYVFGVSQCCCGDEAVFAL